MATPMMQQYYRIKKKHPDTILLFRMGDFYEMFDDDAVVASKILNITLTARNRNAEKPTPLCGIPFHALDQYLVKLIHAGRKIAICEQTEDPKKAIGLVKRDVVKVVTPGLISDPEHLNAHENNYLATLTSNGNKTRFALNYVDITTSRIASTLITSVDALKHELLRILPKEILVSTEEQGFFAALITQHPVLNAITLSHISAGDDARTSKAILFEQFGETIKHVPQLIKQALTLTCHYLRETQKTTLPHLKTIDHYQSSQFLEMDDVSRRNLELFFNNNDMTRERSLIATIDKTKTAMGARLLRQWLLQPLKSKADITARHDIIDFFFRFPEVRKTVASQLRHIYDLERLAAKFALMTVNPRDLLRLKQSLEALPPLLETLVENTTQFPILHHATRNIDPIEPLKNKVEAAIADDAPLLIRNGGIIKDGYNEELDEIRSLARNGKKLIAQLEQRERTRSGISTLRIRFNNVFGYFIEVSKGKARDVPQDYIRKQTLTNCERFFTEELKDYETKILSASERINIIEHRLFTELCQEINSQRSLIEQNAHHIAKIDCLVGFAKLAANYNYVKPLLCDSDTLTITEGRHPVIEQVLAIEGDTFVANDMHFSKERQVMLITGPNMAGKSTIMRQTALICLLNQIGSFVPATHAELPLFDRIFTRVGASDNLTQGHSTFMVEMVETAHILKNATCDSLVLLDEIGRGTSTFDGVSIAWAVLEDIHDRIGAKTLFSTHYHELTRLAESKARIRNFHVSIEENHADNISETTDNIRFLRKLSPGAIEKSYGIHVAEIAGVPPQVTASARKLQALLEETKQPIRHVDLPSPNTLQTLPPQSLPRTKLSCESNALNGVPKQVVQQAEMFPQSTPSTQALQKAVEALIQFPIERRTPIDAMLFLSKIQSKLRDLIARP